MNDDKTPDDTVTPDPSDSPLVRQGQAVLSKLKTTKGIGWAVVTRLAPGVALVLVVLVLVQGNLKSATSAMLDFIQGPMAPGILSLEPPQVYTRERLVNDRFRQANWLENQLDVTNERDTIDDIGRVLSKISAQGHVDVKISTAPSASKDTPPGTDKDAKEPKPAYSPMGSFGQRLVETDKLRSRLRTDLMDTLLDDGHDLEGNTLYRLNFDAVVMPTIGERRYPGTAVYVIRARNPFAPLTPEGACFEDAHATGDALNEIQSMSQVRIVSDECLATLPNNLEDPAHYLKNLKQKQLNDDIELLRDWQTEIQQFLTRVVEQRVQTFQELGRLNNPVDPKEDIALDWYLRLTLIESFLDAIVLDPEIAALCNTDVVKSSAPRAFKSDGLDDQTARCQNWVAKTLGLKWRHGHKMRSPDFDGSNPLSSGIEAAFRRGIRLAHHINTVRHEVGQQAQHVLTQGQDAQNRHQPPQTAGQAAGHCLDKSPLVSVGLVGPAAAPCVDEVSRETSKRPDAVTDQAPAAPQYEDRELKKALVRMITVWQAMRDWHLRREIRTEPEVSVQSEDEAAGKLLTALSRYQDFDPGDAFIDLSRPQLLHEAQGKLRLSSGGEYCFDAYSGTDDGKFKFYRCAMIHASAGRMADNLIAEFILARLHNALPIYDWKNHLSLSSFVDISLSGCGTTGCRIQVKQHKDVPISEFVGGREFDPSAVPLEQRVQFAGLKGSVTPSNMMQALLDIGHDKDMSQFWNALLASRGGPIKINLSDDGVARARRLVENGGLGLVTTSPAISVRDLNESQASQRREVLSCLGLAEELSLADTARTEAYFACRLRHWVDAKRSDLTVYGVSPRAGSGDDLVSSIEAFSRRLAADVAAQGKGSARLDASDSFLNSQVKANPTVVGFSVPPGHQDRREMRSEFVDEATFGWAIRPERMAGGTGYLASRHRLSAVISVPSWWKRIEFDVEACWVTPDQIRAIAQRDNTGQSQHSNWYETLCEVSARSTEGFGRTFEIQVPRRVAEITDRFNFDFIKAPYFYRDFTQRALRGDGLSLEAGRPGKIVLHGERLWRGTFVTVNHQPASRIVVLPDMKGVVASFECVQPPDGARHVNEYKAFAPNARGEAIVESLLVWTSQGSTDPLPVQIYPFTQRAENERPCWMKEN